MSQLSGLESRATHPVPLWIHTQEPDSGWDLVGSKGGGSNCPKDRSGPDHHAPGRWVQGSRGASLECKGELPEQEDAGRGTTLPVNMFQRGVYWWAMDRPRRPLPT